MQVSTQSAALRTRVGVLFVGVTLLLACISVDAEARRGRKRSKGWVPQGAWNAVKKVARTQHDPSARVFKTRVTVQQSRGLKGTHSKAYIVGSKIKRQQRPPRFGFMPYKPQQSFYLVTKGSNRKWSVTPLAGMGGRYLSQVDARSSEPRVGVGVALGNPGKVGHGVEVKNARRLSVTKGTALAAKRSRGKHTVYVKGDTNGQQWANDAKANLRASVTAGGWCGTPFPVNIPVSFNQVMFAAGGAPR